MQNIFWFGSPDEDVDEPAEFIVELQPKNFIVMATHHPKKEGKVAKTQEEQTSRVSSDVYLWAAAGTMALSLTCFLAGKRYASIFFGQWAPSLLIIGLYNKLVKVEGTRKKDKQVSGKVSTARTMT